MGYARLALYLIGLVLVIMAAWVFLTQTPIAEGVPPGVALAIILLIVGLGVMIAANAIDDRFTRRRIVHDGGDYGPRTGSYERRVEYDAPPRDRETVVEERRY